MGASNGMPNFNEIGQSSSSSSTPDFIQKLEEDSHLHPPTAQKSSLQQEGSSSSKDKSSGNFLDKAGRIGEVTALGIADAVPGAIKTIGFDITHPLQTGEMVLSSAALGIAMRTILPESGAIKVIGGTLLGLYFMKDAAKPIFHAWGAAAGNGNINSAATEMGNGLGQFAVDGFISAKVAGAAGAKTPEWGEKYAPKQWASLETFKQSHLAATSPLGMSLHKFTTHVDKSVQAVADKLNSSKPTVDDLTPEERLKMVKNANIEAAAKDKSNSVYRHGQLGVDRMPHGLKMTSALLQVGVDPATIAADQPLPADIAEKLAQLKQARPEAESGNNAGQPQTDAERILNAQTMTDAAKVIKAHLDANPKEAARVDGAVAQQVGAVYSALNPKFTGLPEGYRESLQAMQELAGQVHTEQDQADVGPLFDLFAQASTQHGNPDMSETAMSAVRLNDWFQEIFTEEKRLLGKALNEPKPEKLLKNQNPPLVAVASDQREVAPGQWAHEGPHTIPAQQPAWTVDLVLKPNNELGFRAITDDGIFNHEYGHDANPNEGILDAKDRDAKLSGAISAALGDHANIEEAIPGGGEDPQSTLLNNIARKAKAIEEHQPTDAEQAAGFDPAKVRDEYLTQALQLSPEMKVAKAGGAANALLGDAGEEKIKLSPTETVSATQLVAYVAAMSDDRSPDEVLTEALNQHADKAATQARISHNIDQNLTELLGPQKALMLHQADGSPISVKDAAMQVSDMSRDPQFRTYETPLPKTMTRTEIFVEAAKGLASETYADFKAGTRSGQSAAPYFQAMNEDWSLSSDSVMGQKMRSEENPLGVEVHPPDKLRPRYLAAVVRLLSDGTDKRLMDYADALDAYARATGGPGDIVFASMDHPGQSITLTDEDWDRVIPAIVDLQYNTPLEVLRGRTVRETLPDLKKNMAINDSLADSWAKAIQQGDDPSTIPFDTNTVTRSNVMGAGQPTFLRLMAARTDENPLELNEKVNQFRDYFLDQFRGSKAHIDPIQTTFRQSIRFAPAQTLRAVPAQINDGLANFVVKQATARSWIDKNAVPISAVGTSYLVQDLLGLQKRKQEMLNSKGQ